MLNLWMATCLLGRALYLCGEHTMVDEQFMYMMTYTVRHDHIM